MNSHYVNPNVNYGRFAEIDELRSSYTKISYDGGIKAAATPAAGIGIEAYTNKDGNVTGALVDGGDTNTIIVSATGSGKTRRFLSPYILSCINAGHSFVAHDPKGELYCFFAKLLEKNNYNVKILNFRDPMTGDRLNILEKPAKLVREGNEGRALEIAREIADTLFSPMADKDDPFWTESSANLFMCYFLMAAHELEPEDVTLANIYRIHIEGLGRNGLKLNLAEYLDKHSGEKICEFGLPSVNAPSDTRNSIYATFSNSIARIVLNEDIADMMTKSTVDVEELAEKPTAVFIITRDEAPKAYSTAVASMVDDIYTSLIDLAQSKYNNRLPVNVHFILEEFGNIARLNNINDMMTASRSRGIRMVIVLQSLCQLNVTYPKALSEVLIGNSQNLVYLSSTDMTLVETISKRCGVTVDPYTFVERPLLSSDRLMHLDKTSGEALLLLDRNYPYITHMPDVSAYKMIEPLEKLELKKREKLPDSTERIAGIFKKKVKNSFDRPVMPVPEIPPAPLPNDFNPFNHFDGTEPKKPKTPYTDWFKKAIEDGCKGD